MSIYTYIFSQSLCESLGIKFQKIPELSDQEINKISELEQNKIHQRLGIIAWTGQHHTLQAKQKISDSQKGISKTDEHRKSLSVAAKQRYSDSSNHPMYGKRGQNNPKFGKHYGQMKKDVCPHCQKVVAINNIKRYHYENCRMKRNAN